MNRTDNDGCQSYDFRISSQTNFEYRFSITWALQLFDRFYTQKWLSTQPKNRAERLNLQWFLLWVYCSLKPKFNRATLSPSPHQHWNRKDWFYMNAVQVVYIFIYFSMVIWILNKLPKFPSKNNNVLYTWSTVGTYFQ